MNHQALEIDPLVLIEAAETFVEAFTTDINDEGMAFRCLVTSFALNAEVAFDGNNSELVTKAIVDGLIDAHKADLFTSSSLDNSTLTREKLTNFIQGKIELDELKK